MTLKLSRCKKDRRVIHPGQGFVFCIKYTMPATWLRINNLFRKISSSLTEDIKIIHEIRKILNGNKGVLRSSIAVPYECFNAYSIDGLRKSLFKIMNQVFCGMSIKTEK